MPRPSGEQDPSGRSKGGAHRARVAGEELVEELQLLVVQKDGVAEGNGNLPAAREDGDASTAVEDVGILGGGKEGAAGPACLPSDEEADETHQ